MQATSPPPIASGKEAWRKWLRARTEPRPEQANTAILREILALLETLPPTTIAAFSGMADEPDLWPLIDAGHGHRWLLPRIDGVDLTFHALRSRAETVAGVFGILEPRPEMPSADPAEIGLVLCPGLGFGRDLSRIGRGKGYYDRFLARLRPGTPVAGVAFPCRIVDAVPVGPLDIPMTRLIGA